MHFSLRDGRLENKLKREKLIFDILSNMPQYVTDYYYNLSASRESSSCLEHIRKIRKFLLYLNSDINKIDKWQGGDIIVFKKHIGIVSDNRNKKGISFIIHHANPYQKYYEEDILEYRDDIVGHYRIS